MNPANLPLISQTRLVDDLIGLGVQLGQTVLLPASVTRIGWIVGGPDVVLRTLLPAHR